MSRKPRGKDTQSAWFHFLWSSSLTAGAASANLNATGLGSLSTRFLSIADSWVFFRLKSFKFRIHPGNVSANQAACVLAVVDTSPSTLSQVMEQMNATYIDQSQTVPTGWVNVDRPTLAGPFPWYRCVDGTADTSEENPARLVVIGTGTDTFAMEFLMEVEFKEAAATANTPMELALLKARREEEVARARARAKLALLDVLSADTAIAGPNKPSVAVPPAAAAGNSQDLMARLTAGLGGRQ